MKYRKRRNFTQADRNLMWDRWQKGESLNAIARLLGTSHSAITGVLSKTGGVRPAERQRSGVALTLARSGYFPAHRLVSTGLQEIIITNAWSFNQ